ncbi:hypothetical protein BpHYR1_045606 [Brachionus plicatilis]|uniref:Uncharacterized protein n=1 Tax=Brachionus plicatilis TaxID=10195 RepID=A0A3M7S688_BRAPC|nr:hypothetical protein BpHYR1_045606 [Brachionus plicatilis]
MKVYETKVVNEITCNMSLAFKFEANNFNNLTIMLSFSFKTLFYHNSPENLKDRLIKNESRDLSYNLRNSANLIEPMAKTNCKMKQYKLNKNQCLINFYYALNPLNCFESLELAR